MEVRKASSAAAGPDVCIRGSGIVGRTLALLLARQRLRVALVESPEPAAGSQPDIRAYALNHASHAVLSSLKCWPAPELATPVRRMQIQGDGAAHTVFDAQRLRASELTWIVDVPALEDQLRQACRYQSSLDVVTPQQADTLPAALTVICEGRHSPTRRLLGVDDRAMPYGQSAIATRATLDAGHEQIAWQWFHHDGQAGSILAWLPLDGSEGRSVAVVWSVDRRQLPELLALDDEAFAQALQAAAHPASGPRAPNVQSVQRRVSWPLQLGMAQQWCGRWPEHAPPALRGQSWALAGDAAHSVHPLAGQGLNLGLADAAALDAVIGARAAWRSPGDLRLLRQYERTRKARMAPLVAGMDGIQRLFSHSAVGARELRNAGLALFERSGPVKRLVARQAMR